MNRILDFLSDEDNEILVIAWTMAVLSLGLLVIYYSTFSISTGFNIEVIVLLSWLNLFICSTFLANHYFGLKSALLLFFLWFVAECFALYFFKFSIFIV